MCYYHYPYFPDKQTEVKYLAQGETPRMWEGKSSVAPESILPTVMLYLLCACDDNKNLPRGSGSEDRALIRVKNLRNTDSGTSKLSGSAFLLEH